MKILLTLSSLLSVSVPSSYAREDFPESQRKIGNSASIITDYIQPCPTSECVDQLQPACDLSKAGIENQFNVHLQRDPRLTDSKLEVLSTARFRGPLDDSRYRKYIGVYCDAKLEIESDLFQLRRVTSRSFYRMEKCDELLETAESKRLLLFGSVSEIPGGFLQPKTCRVHLLEIVHKQ